MEGGRGRAVADFYMLLPDVVDLVCLAYHEARNVRYPIKAGKLSDAPEYQRVKSLPKNRYRAWQHMEKVRAQCTGADSIDEVLRIFQANYGLSVDELVVLYEKPCWKDSKYGGNKWTPICIRLLTLVGALRSHDYETAKNLIQRIRDMEHNTGKVGRKLEELRRYGE